MPRIKGFYQFSLCTSHQYDTEKFKEKDFNWTLVSNDDNNFSLILNDTLLEKLQRETGPSRYHGKPIEGPPEILQISQHMVSRSNRWGPELHREALVSGTVEEKFLSLVSHEEA